MKRLKLLRYFTIYSLIAFIFTGATIVLFMTTHMKNDKINSLEQMTHFDGVIVDVFLNIDIKALLKP